MSPLYVFSLLSLYTCAEESPSSSLKSLLLAAAATHEQIKRKEEAEVESRAPRLRRSYVGLRNACRERAKLEVDFFYCTSGFGKLMLCDLLFPVHKRAQ